MFLLYYYVIIDDAMMPFINYDVKHDLIDRSRTFGSNVVIFTTSAGKINISNFRNVQNHKRLIQLYYSDYVA